MKNLTIRLETEKDYRAVEHLTREAFWNQNVPGCDEHYLVHKMRTHADFLPELAFVLEKDGEIIGNIMYTKTRLVDERGNEKQILTFGPISVLPAYQRQGYGKMLIEHSFAKASALGYDTVVIFGNPDIMWRAGSKAARSTMSAWKVMCSHPRCLSKNCVRESSTAEDGISAKALSENAVRMKTALPLLTRPFRLRKRHGSPAKKNFTFTATRRWYDKTKR